MATGESATYLFDHLIVPDLGRPFGADVSDFQATQVIDSAEKPFCKIAMARRL
jgi:hypothetical protein